MRPGRRALSRRSPACLALVILLPGRGTLAGVPGPQVKRASQCPEGGIVLYTSRVNWMDEARAVVEAGVLRIQSRHYRTWKERPDWRAITIEWQPDLGWVATGMEIVER